MSAAAPPTRRSILNLYSSMLRTSRSFSSYNFRNYFVNRTKEKFRLLQAETDAERVRTMYADASSELAVLRRSAAVNRMYGGWKLAVEKA
ncbi:Complex 1 protein (Lyr family) protein [Mycena kentingensis (nom. inval.)]|nr:Complex 1 protein (Lyr family) protein [Mycena kentingensis (nom. inval.)]